MSPIYVVLIAVILVTSGCRGHPDHFCGLEKVVAVILVTFVNLIITSRSP